MSWDAARKRIYIPSGEDFIFVYQQLTPIITSASPKFLPPLARAYVFMGK